MLVLKIVQYTIEVAVFCFKSLLFALTLASFGFYKQEKQTIRV